MAHYAFLDDNNIVTEVIVGIDETELIEGKSPEDWYGEFRGQKCVRTSYNAASNGFRYHYAGIGYIYDPVEDAFIGPTPYPSWVLDKNKNWVAPVEKPTDGGSYSWDEETGTWIETKTL